MRPSVFCVGALVLALLPACRPRRQPEQAVAPLPTIAPEKPEPEETAPEPPPPPPPPPAPTSEPPRAEAGFPFGIARREAMNLCTVKFIWRREGTNFSCDKPVQNPGFDGRPVLSFCEDRLCAVGVAIVPDKPDWPSWDAAFGKVQAVLVARHGLPTTSDDQIPDDCKNERFVECLDSGKAKKELAWKWDTHVVLLKMSKKQSGGPSAIRFVSMPASK